MVLTPKGARTRAALTRELYRPPSELTRLPARQLEALATALEALGPASMGV